MVVTRFLLSCAILLLPVAVGAAPVVIDAGHGGEQPGTRTAAGVLEKSIVLEVARAARTTLEASGVSVVMTREGDQRLGLAERASIANRNGARAFISIHANWSPVATRRGVETYVVAAKLSDEGDVGLLEAENGESEHVPRAFDESGSDLQVLLSSLERMAAHEGSAKLASAVQGELGAIPALGPSRGLRQAPFAVLVGSRVPAVLVELGYLSHPVQGQELSSPEVQRAAGRAIARAVLTFLSRSPRN